MAEISRGQIVVYVAPDGSAQVDVRLERDTVWLSLNQMADLFDRDKSVISRHLRNVFRSGELDRGAVVAKNATTAADGKTYHVEYFNLDAILSVGYRVNSLRGTQFRIWATTILRDHLLRGYTGGILADSRPVNWHSAEINSCIQPLTSSREHENCGSRP